MITRNSDGFAHQMLIMALVVAAVIGGIGSYIYLHKSSAATCSNATTCTYGSWHTIKSTSNTWNFTKAAAWHDFSGTSLYVMQGLKYRWCMVGKQASGWNSNSGGTVTMTNAGAAYLYTNQNVFVYGSSISAQTYCSAGAYAKTNFTVSAASIYNGQGTPLTFSKVFWQRYY